MKKAKKVIEVKENINIPPYQEKSVEDTIVAEKPVKKTNTHGIKNLNKGFRKNPKEATTYRLIKERRDRKGHIKFPIVYMLKAEDIIFDEEKGINRKIRYIPGESSIFEDEQKEDAKVKSPITFSNGFLRVDYTNPTLKKFLDMCNSNSSNPNRVATSPASFKLMDYAKQAQERLQKSVKSMDALKLVFELPLDKLLGYAQVLGVRVDKSTDEIRYDMKVLAEKDPEKFITGLDDPKMEIKQSLLRAKDFGIIDWNAQQVMWVQGDTRPVITKVPLGVKPVDFLADKCMTDSGSSIMDQIKIHLSKYN